MKNYDVLYILVIPINIFYHFSYKYLYEKNKKINDFKDYTRASNIDILSRNSWIILYNSWVAQTLRVYI